MSNETGSVAGGDPFARFAVGDVAEQAKTVTGEDVVRFAEITGDMNPVHLDDAAGAASPFGSRVAHGMLTGGLISAALATQLPGPGAIYVSQTLEFLRPVRIGDTVTTRVEIVEVQAAQRTLRLTTVSRNQRGKRIAEGEAVVLVPPSAATGA